MKPPLPWKDTLRLLELAGVEQHDPIFPSAAIRLAMVVGTHHRGTDIRSKVNGARDRARGLGALAGHLRNALKLLKHEELHLDIIDAWQRTRVAHMDEATERRWANDMLCSLQLEKEMAEPWLEDMGNDVRALCRFADAAECAEAQYRLDSSIASITNDLADLWEFLGKGTPKPSKTWDGPYESQFAEFARATIEALGAGAATALKTLGKITTALERRSRRRNKDGASGP